MSGQVHSERQGHLIVVSLLHPGKLNAMSCAMWHGLRSVFQEIAQDPGLRCVVLRGDGGQFCAGGDNAEYPDFRFSEAGLRNFHEHEVWPGLDAVQSCELPVVAQIEGNCMGAGLELAACCDLRIAGTSTRFGAPIAKLGFPMAPREIELVAAQIGPSLAKEILFEAATLGAQRLFQTGFLSRVVDDAQVGKEAMATACRIAALSPQAAKLNKRTLRALQAGSLPGDLAADPAAYAWADSSEHREGILAFLEKRSPEF